MFLDSLTYKLEAFDYDEEAGSITNRRCVFDFEANGVKGIPDGLTIDTNGHLWVAMFGGSQVIAAHGVPQSGWPMGVFLSYLILSYLLQSLKK